MTDRDAPHSYTVAELSKLLDLPLQGAGELSICGVASPEEAGPAHIAPVTSAASLEQAAASRAGAFLVLRPVAGEARPQLICADPREALGRLLELYAPPAPEEEVGIDPRAAVHATARVSPGAWVGPFSYLGPGAAVGEGSRVEPFCYVGAGAEVGRRCMLGPGAVLMRGCRLEDGVVLGPGAVVGGDGFGYYRGQGAWRRILSLGSVVVGAGSELGANACVDRGTLGPTRLGRGVMLDNLVQVGHNCLLDDGALLCAQAGLAGSVHLRPGAVLAGQVGVADHRTVGAGARVGAHSGVGQDVPDGAEVSGYPAIAHRRWLRSMALIPRLTDLARQVRQLSARVEALTRAQGPGLPCGGGADPLKQEASDHAER